MSAAYKCDRCGECADGAPQGRITYDPKNFVERWGIGKKATELALCMACGIQFVAWFRCVLDLRPAPDSPASSEAGER